MLPQTRYTSAPKNSTTNVSSTGYLHTYVALDLTFERARTIFECLQTGDGERQAVLAILTSTAECLGWTSLHGGRWGGVRENSRLASMERAPPDAFLADNSLVPACGHCSVDLSDSPDLGASLFQVRGVKGLQRQSSCANWSFDEGCPKSRFPHRGLHGGLFHVFIGKVVPFSSCTNCQHMPALVSVHLIGPRDRHLSKLQ